MPGLVKTVMAAQICYMCIPELSYLESNILIINPNKAVSMN